MIPADMVLRGGKIATVDSAFTIAEALAVAGDKFVFVGANQDVEEFIGPDTEIIELDGKLVVPGLIDAHGHLMTYGTSLAS
ncbi:MAG: amidohydrolase, partial [Planctomycetes bacterium]|nr:amidohydrolase [Planctomycetota bacterium]